MSCCNKAWRKRQICTGNEQFANTYLIPHHRIANIFDQTSEFIRILDVGEKALDLPLVFQQLELSENLLQFPSNPSLSDSTLDLEECELTLRVLSSLILPSCRPQRRVCKVRQKGY